MSAFQMISADNRLPKGLNEPVEVKELDSYKDYKISQAISGGLLVYVDPDGHITFKKGTKIRGFRVGETFYSFLQSKIEILYQNQDYKDISMIFIITCSENCLVNTEYNKIVPSITFIGGIDMSGKYYQPDYFDFSQNKDLFLHRDLEQILTDLKEDKINILQTISFEEATGRFNKNEALIFSKENSIPIKLFNSEHQEMLQNLSHNQNDFELFCNYTNSMIKKSDILNEYMYNESFIEKAKKIAEECCIYLTSICKHKVWLKEKNKFCKNCDHLLSIIKKVDIGLTIEKKDMNGIKSGLPQNFFTIKKMKLQSSKCFFQKLFSSEKGVSYRMLNKITDYN